MGKIFLRYS